jgi:5-methylcytosine-specific restriction endonuclease McrA
VDDKRWRAKEARERWRKANPEAYAAIQARQYRRHAAKRKAAARRRYRENRKKEKERARAWARANPERKAALNAAWRSAPLTGEGVEYAAILYRDPCSFCGGRAGQIDHIDAIARGGDGDWGNLTAACPECNQRKHAKPLLAFLAEAA